MIEIKRGLTTIAQSEEYSYSGEHMSKKSVSVEVESPTPISFLVGDKVSYRGDTFYVINAPTENETFSKGLIKYNLIFVHEQYEMGNVLFRDVVPNNPDNEYYNTQTHDVVFVGTVETLMGRFIANMDRDHAGWSYVIDPAVTLESMEIALINQFCSDALLLVHSLFKLEFRISNKVIYIGGLGTQVGGIFEYGKGKGICELTRTSENKKTITRLYIDSSNRNIPTDYNVTEQFLYNPKLMLPDWKTTNINYVDSPLIDLNNIKEGILPNEDIFPSLEGTGLNDIIQVDPIADDDAGFTIYIKDLGFDIKDQLIKGRTAVIEMVNGLLEAKSFDIHSIEADTSVAGASYKLVVIRNTDIVNMPLPNDITAIKTGDRFVLLNINMDESYILDAETRLLAWGQAQFTDHNIDKESVTYNAKFSEEDIYGSTQEDDVREGNLVHIVDAKNAVDKSIIIQKLIITHSGSKIIPAYDLSIADTVVASKFDQIIEDQDTLKKSTVVDIKMNATVARRTNKALNLMDDYLMDDDGKLRETNIKAGSIDALKLSVGTRSGNFVLNAKIIPNYEGDADKVFCSLGTLIHLESDINFTAGNNVWNIAENATFDMTTGVIYFLYVKANKDAGSATWEIFTSAQVVDQVDYYFLPWGLLLIDGDGNRLAQSTKGKTYIVGDQLYTGKVQDISGQNYIDLTTGKVNIGTVSSGFDWDITNADAMTLRGAFVQSEGGFQSVIGVWRGAWTVATDYFVGEEVAYNGSSYRCDVNNTGELPTDTNFFTVIAEGGAAGVDGADGSSVYIEYSVNGTSNWHTTYATADLYLRQNVLGVWSDAMKFIGDDGSDGSNGADGVDGDDGASIVWKGSFASHPASPENGWAYYNTTDKKSYIYQGAWYQMTIDGIDGNDGADGISIIWKGESSSPPANPEVNWAYRDTDNGITYIYTGSAWEVMVNDGTDGSNGTDVEVEYSIDGSTNWHDDYVSGDKYLRQNVLGVWSPAMKFIGDNGADGTDGVDGDDGAKGAGIAFRGNYNALTTYYGQANRVDVVKYNSVYYVAKHTAGTFSGITPTNTTYWESFGASFTSVATEVLFAEAATIDNLVVELAHLGTTVITDGTYIKATLIDVDTLIVKNLKTATSGQRLEISGANNNLTLKNSAGTTLVNIDDSVFGSFSGIAMQGNPILHMTNGTDNAYMNAYELYVDDITCDYIAAESITFSSSSQSYPYSSANNGELLASGSYLYYKDLSGTVYRVNMTSI